MRMLKLAASLLLLISVVATAAEPAHDDSADKGAPARTPARAPAKDAAKEAAAPADKAVAATSEDSLRKALAERLKGSGDMVIKTSDDGAAPAAKPVVRRRPAPKPEAEMEKTGPAHWSYEGEMGPSNWGKLSKDYMKCETGLRQSPIDVRDAIKVDLDPIQFDYKATPFRVVDNGHTIQVNLAEGSSIMVNGKQYNLVQFHFHRPSEERIEGKRYELSLHLVHKSEDGQLAVVSLALEKGSEQAVVQMVWNNMPLERNVEVVPTHPSLDPAMLLPANRGYYMFMGSLTTPPCSEGVLWLVMKTPIQVSPDQIAIFARLYPNNARPLQKTAARLIKESRTAIMAPAMSGGTQ